jgi:hypothetical protein
MAAKDDFDILDAAVKSGKQSVTLPDGRTFNLDEARTERDRLGKELNKQETDAATEESIKAQQIKDAEKIVKNRESLLTQTLRAFSKNNASAEQVKKAQDNLRNASEFLARLTSQTVVTAPATAPAAVGSAAGLGETEEQALARVALTADDDPPADDVPGAPPKTVFSKADVNAKLVELGLEDTPANRKTARQALRAGTTAAPAVVDTSWEPLFKTNYPQYSWMFTDLDRTKYADVFTLFKFAQANEMKNEDFDRRWKGTSFYRELESSKKGRELSTAIGNFTWGSGNLAKFLTKATQFGYEGENLKQQAYKELFSKVDGKYANDLAVGEIKKSTPYLSLKDIGKQYFWDIGDSQIEQVLSGVEDAVTGIATSREDLIRKARLYAKGKYAHLSEQIDGGLTMEDLAASYREKAAQLLELDPLTMNFDRDYSDALGSVDRPRVLSLSEWETELRTNDKYKYSFTKRANQDATDIGLAIARAFGKVQ